MLWQFKINCRNENGKPLHEVTVVHNGRLILKEKGNSEEFFQCIFGLLIDSPQQYYLDFTVTGSDDDIDSYKTMLAEWKLQKSAHKHRPILTQRHHDCIELLKKGKNEKEISEILHVSYQWVRVLFSQIYHIFHCKGKGELLSILLNRNQLG